MAKIIIEPSSKISPYEKLDELPEILNISVERWYNERFIPGIYFDKRFDRRILWTWGDIRDYWDSGNRNLLINPLIYGDVESCLENAEDIMSSKDIDYFDDILHNQQSIIAPNYLVGPKGKFPGFQVPAVMGCPLITLEGKNRTIALALLYLNDPKRVGQWRVNICDVHKATRPTLSLIYQRLSKGRKPNSMMIRIGQWSQTGDFIYNLRNSLRNQSVIRKGFVRDINNPKTMDLFDLFVSDKTKLQMVDDEMLCYTLNVVTHGNYKNLTPSIDLMYETDSGDTQKCKKVIDKTADFVKQYYNNINTKGGTTGWKLNKPGYYLVTHFCKYLIDSKHKILQKNWGEVVTKFHEWYFTMTNVKGKKGQKFWTDANGNIRNFKETLTYFQTNVKAMDTILKCMFKDLYQPLCDGDYIKTSTDELLSVSEKIQCWEENPYRRIQGSVEKVEFKNTPHGKKAEKKFGYTLDMLGEWEEISLTEALGPDTNGDHKIPKTRGGKHEFDNWELTSDVYNNWKSDRLPDYL